MTERMPAEAFPPGEHLRDELEARGWTQAEFAEIIGRPTRLINEIIAGKRTITPATAKEIGAALGTSPLLWLNLEAAYQLHGREPVSPRIVLRAKLREKFPVREMINRQWIESSENPEVLESHLFAFFGIQNIDERPSLAHAAKKTGYPADLAGPQLAWLFRVKQIASAMIVQPYSEEALRNALDRLKSLLLSPEEIRHVPRILAEAGVRFVIVEHVPSSKIDGVCFWLDADSPVIGMSLRLDRIDNFWFVLRHEIEHVLRKHGREEALIDQDIAATDPPSDADLPQEEQTANAAGAEFCVPASEMADFILRNRPLFPEENVLNFSRRMQVHPGLVVGQLQKQLGNWRIFRQYLVKVRHLIAPVAMTDGFGQAVPL